MVPAYVSNIIQWPSRLWVADLGLPNMPIRMLWKWPELFTSQATLGRN